MTVAFPGGAAPSRKLWILYAVAAAAFFPALRFHYVGEEAILTVSSIEMEFHQEWLRQRLLGADVQHNPLINWILMIAGPVVGWEHVLPLARAVSIAATVGTGLVLAWLARRVSGDATLGALAAVVYLMLGDLVLYRGWLAYTDPLFGFFIFSAAACAWTACRDRSVPLLAAAVALISAAMLTKALTAYVFYGTVLLVLMFDRESRAFLLRWPSLVLHAACAAFIVVWFGLVVAGGEQGQRMFNEILHKLRGGEALDYLMKLGAYPLETFVKLSPAVPLAAYYATRGGGPHPAWARIVLAVAVLSFLPYWLAPESHTRYLLPVYPWIALLCAYMILRAGARALTVTVRWWAALLAVKLALFLAIFPYYQKTYRGENYERVAMELIERTAGHPLYSTNDSASGLAVAAHIHVRRLPAPPITFPPRAWDSGFVISYRPDPGLGRVVAEYRLGGAPLYLLCRGAACGKLGEDRVSRASRSVL